MKYILFVIVLFFCFHSEAQRQHIIFESTFENPNYISQWDSIEQCNANSVTPSTTVKRAGNQSVKFLSNIIDTVNCTLVRSQLILYETTAINYERWYGFSVYFANGFPSTYDGYDAFFQMFRADSVELIPPFIRPPMFLTYSAYDGPQKYVVINRMINSPDSVVPQSPMTHYIAPVKEIQLNTWVDIIMNIKWRNDSTGMMKIWVNDQLKFSFNGHTNYTPNYIRIGIDKWDWRLNWHTSSTPSREIYFDEFRIGDSLATYMDVRPGPGIPLPILWTFFDAHKNNTCVNLYWEAEFGTNFVKFIVERNTGTGWESIGQVENNIQHRFGSIDCHPKLNNLYRIRAINTGEADSYSSVKSVRFTGSGPQKIYVFNSIGQLIKVQTVYGITLYEIKNELRLIPGLYIVRYEDGETEKILIL